MSSLREVKVPSFFNYSTKPYFRQPLVTVCALSLCPLTVNGVGVQIEDFGHHSVKNSSHGHWLGSGQTGECGPQSLENLRWREADCHPSNLMTVQSPDPDSIEIKREKLLFLTKNRENFLLWWEEPRVCRCCLHNAPYQDICWIQSGILSCRQPPSFLL